jgi:hypothetical protein
MSLTKLTLGGNYDVIFKLFLPREGLVSERPNGPLDSSFYIKLKFSKLYLPMRRTKSTKVLEAMNPMTKAKHMMMELAMVLT